MSFATKADLEEQIVDWLARAELEGLAPDMITLAEARLNRVLPVIEADATLTAVPASRFLDISAFTVASPIALYFVINPGPVSPSYTLEDLDAVGSLDDLPASLDSNYWRGGESLSGERKLRSQVAGSIPFVDGVGEPAWWTFDGTGIVLDRPCAAPYTFRLHYRGRLKLVAARDSNWLLQNHPDIYFAACIVWGAVHGKEDADVRRWKLLLEEGLSEVRSELGRGRRGTLTVDRMLLPAFS